MKRIAAVMSAVVLLLVCVLTGCNTLASLKGQVTAYSLLKGAFEKTNGLDGVELKMTVDLHAEATGVTMDIPIQYDFKVRDFSKEDPVGYGKIRTEVMMQKLEQEFWFDGDYLYIDREGEKLKFQKDSDEAGSYMSFDFKELLKELPEETLEGVKVVKNEDGSKTFSTDISEEVFDEIFAEFGEDTEGVAVEEFLDENNVSVEMSNYHVEVTALENGYLGSYALSFDLKVDADGDGVVLEQPVSVCYAIKAKVEFIDPGKEVTVTLPADLDEYMDYEEYYEKYPYGPDWEYNEETGKYTYVAEDGFWLYDEEKDDWYTEQDGERFYFNEDSVIHWEDWEYNEETGKYTYVGEDGAWLYDEEKDDWYTEQDGERSYFNGDLFDFGPDWEYNEETGKYTYVGEDEDWLYDEEKDDWYCEVGGERIYFNEDIVG